MHNYGCEIPAKTLNSLAFVNVWAIGRDTQVWYNPDLNMFLERFTDPCYNINVELRGGQNFELIPFGAGRGICPYSIKKFE